MRHARSAFALFLALLLAPLPLAGAAERAADGKIPVILHTDIGDDIDDTWALALLLRSPALDLKLVVTDFGDTVYRAKLVARLLEIAGRTDVPIGIGRRTAEKGGAQEEWLKGYDLARYPGKVHQDGVQALIDTVMASPVPMTLIAIGPPPNVKLALEREPRLASKLRFAGTYGSVHRGCNDKPQPEPEWNVKAAPDAARAVLSAPWLDAISTPLDTCGKVLLDGERYARIAASRDPLAQAMWAARDEKLARARELRATLRAQKAAA
jgi:inosine-uridine nucleoside N-ribohydrolase